MADVPGLKSDVFFGSPDKPLPEWRNVRTTADPDDDTLTPEERKGLVAILGFDPGEFDRATTPKKPRNA